MSGGGKTCVILIPAIMKFRGLVHLLALVYLEYVVGERANVSIPQSTTNLSLFEPIGRVRVNETLSLTLLGSHLRV